MMTQANTKKSFEVAGAANLRRQLHTDLNTRFLRNLPAFKTEGALSKDLEQLLDQLDQAEKTRRYS